MKWISTKDPKSHLSHLLHYGLWAPRKIIHFTDDEVNPFVTLLADVETNFCGGNKAS